MKKVLFERGHVVDFEITPNIIVKKHDIDNFCLALCNSTFSWLAIQDCSFIQLTFEVIISPSNQLFVKVSSTI